MIAMTKKAGLQCYADLFIGFPGETPETLRETERLLHEARPTAINLSVLFPLPDTAVYEQGREEETLIGDWSPDGPRPWIKLPWVEKLGDLFEIRDKIHRRYLRQPAVMLDVLRFMVFRITPKQLGSLISYYLRIMFKK